MGHRDPQKWEWGCKGETFFGIARNIFESSHILSLFATKEGIYTPGFLFHWPSLSSVCGR